jgi:hypothetical protein
MFIALLSVEIVSDRGMVKVTNQVFHAAI